MEGLATPNVQEMFNQYMMGLMRNTPGAVFGGVLLENFGVGGVAQPARMDFAKICKDYTSLEGKPFSGIEDIMEVQEWI